MADRNSADSRRVIAVDPPPHQNPRDMHESDNDPIPLSPQWLLPRAGDNKELNPHHGSRSDALKLSVDNEDVYSSGKKMGAFKPSSHELESGRWDRWREEERETNSVRRDKRWEGEKEPSETTRRVDRWSEFSNKQTGEARRAPAEKWNDSNNRDGDQRRESKWNTRWGPDDKESENWRDKRVDSRRDGDGVHDKAIPYQSGLGKDINTQGREIERDDHHSRSWRSNYFVGRGRGDSFHDQSTASGRHDSLFSHGRGRTENGTSALSAGRGRLNSSTSTISNFVARTHHSFNEKLDGTSGDPPTFRYTRMKLLDIYRSTDVKSPKPLDCFLEVPSLMQEETLEPLALFAPTSEELVVLKGIDKGDIVNSGASQLSKDGSVGKTTDSSSSRPKLVVRDEVTTAGDISRIDNLTEIKDETAIRDVNKLESSPYIVPQRSQMTGGNTQRSSRDWKDVTADVGSRESYMGLPPFQKDMRTDYKSNTDINSTIYKDERQWQNFEVFGHQSNAKTDPRSRQPPPEIMEESKARLIREDSFNSRDVLTSRKLQPHPSPEDLSLYYKDPQGQIQGPFSGSDLIGWFEAGYFGIDLLVRPANSPPDTPFSLLGDVMPHLRMKARPPPGFATAKQIDTLEESYRLKIGGSSNVQTGPSEFDKLKNERRGMHDVTTEAQSRFLESLMSGNVVTSSKENITFTRGIQELGANLSTGIIPNMGGESGRDVNYLSAQTRLLERQRTSNPLPYWSVRDAIPVTSSVERISDPYSKVMQPEETSRPLQPSQQVDLLSLLQAAADKSQPAANNGASWSNFNEPRNHANAIHGIGVSHDQLGLHHNPIMASGTSQIGFGMQHQSSLATNQSSGTSQIGFGIQQQNSLATNQSSLSHLINQHGDISSSFHAPEKLPSSDVYQDPQLLSLLQQQYLLTQLQLQSQMSVSPQLSVLDKIILLQQQQKQEQQQKLLMQQQQQLLLNQVLSGQQAHQQFVDSTFGQADASIPAVNHSMEHFGLSRVHEPLQINQQISAANLNSGQPSYLQNAAMQGSPDVNSLASQPINLPLPHQVFERSSLSREPDSSIPRHNDNSLKDSVIQTPVVMESVPLEEVLNKHEDISITQLSQGPSNIDTEHEVDLTSQTDELIAPYGSKDLNNLQSVGQVSSDLGSSISDKVHDLKISSEELPDQHSVELPSQKEANNTGSRDSKKSSEKKSRKQKSSKTQLAADNGKGQSKVVSGQKSKTESKSYNLIDAGDMKTKLQKDDEDLVVGVDDSVLSSAEPEDPEKSNNHESKVVEGEAEAMLDGRATVTQPSQRAWKSAPGVKPKSLLEIQQEEQLRAQKEGASSEIAPLVTPSSLAAPWAAVINSENKSNKATNQMFNSTSALSTSEKNLNANRSQLHDLLAEEVLANTNEVNTEQLATKEMVLTAPLHVPVVSQLDPSTADGDDFVEAKDTRKSRRKASKSKASAVKIPSPVGSVDTSAALVLTDKGKSHRQVHHEKESLPAPSSGPSLGDFVPWKGDQSSSSSTPAWSLDSGKSQKPTSLRDILREQEKKAVSMPQQVPISVPLPAKVQSNRSGRGSGASWQVSGSSPSHLVSPSQISSEVATSSRPKVEDDLFWGPLEQLKPEPKRLDFPSLSSAGSLGLKGGPAKGAPGAPSRGKPSGEVLVDNPLSTTVASSRAASKGRVDSVMKSSEALDFRNWCQNEWVKLTGTNDISFLEFCIKQSTSEAEMLLRENLGSLDRNHEFIDKFLNYKEFLSPDVIEIAFQAQKSNISSSDSKRRGNSNLTVSRDDDGGPDDRNDETARGGGTKKKGKKGHKVSLSALGFNVVSNRIMMGEIQSIEE